MSRGPVGALGRTLSGAKGRNEPRRPFRFRVVKKLRPRDEPDVGAATGRERGYVRHSLSSRFRVAGQGSVMFFPAPDGAMSDGSQGSGRAAQASLRLTTHRDRSPSRATETSRRFSPLPELHFFTREFQGLRQIPSPWKAGFAIKPRKIIGVLLQAPLRSIARN